MRQIDLQLCISRLCSIKRLRMSDMDHGTVKFRIATSICACLALPASATEFSVPGSGPPQAVVAALAAAFNQTQNVDRVTVPPSTGVAGALRAIRSQESPIARIGRPLNEDEMREGLRCLPFARIPLAFVTGTDVTSNHLSETQLAGIFSGRISDWHELGGKSAPIRVVSRQASEGMLLEIRKKLPAFRNLEFSPDAKMVQSDEQALDLLDRFGYAIGWATITNLPSAKSTLKPLYLNGVAPNAENLASGKYPLAITGCFVYKDGISNSALRAYLDFVFSASGRAVIEKQGALAVARP